MPKTATHSYDWLFRMYESAKSERLVYEHHFHELEWFLGMSNRVQDFTNGTTTGMRPRQEMLFVNDGSGHESSKQCGDYISGILFNPNNFSIVPSDELENLELGDFTQFFNYINKQTKRYIYGGDSNIIDCALPYCREQVVYGNSGLGVFKSNNIYNENPLEFRNIGVYNSAIGNTQGQTNRIFIHYDWTADDCINELGEEYLPEKILCKKNDYMRKFRIVQAIITNNEYTGAEEGIKSAKAKGIWFIDKDIIKTDYYSEYPIAYTKAINIAGYTYGTSMGKIALPLVKQLNYVSGLSIDNINLKNKPLMAMINGALANNTQAVNLSPNRPLVLNPVLANGQLPIQPIYTAGDVSALVQYFMTLRTSQVERIFKLDLLNDFGNTTRRTAYEVGDIISTRAKILSGLFMPQLVMLNRLYSRCISILWNEGKFEMANFKPPKELERMIKKGKNWFDIKFKGELETFLSPDDGKNLSYFLQMLSGAAQFDNNLVLALNGYDLIELVVKICHLENDDIIKSKFGYADAVTAMQQVQAQAQQQQQQLEQMKILSKTKLPDVKEERIF